MNEFLVRFSNTESAMDHMQQVESEIHSEEEEVSRIRRGFRHEFGGKERILQNLKTQMDNMAILGDHAQTFQTTLSSIMELYRAVEDNLVDSIGLPEVQSVPSPLPGGAETGEESEAQEPAPMVDTIHRSLIADESRGFIVGGSLVGAAVLGAAAGGADSEGDLSANLQAAEFVSENEEESPLVQMAAGQEGTAAVSADLDSITSAVPEFSDDFLEKISKVTSWDEFLAFFPQDTVEQLPEAAKNYLQQLFERFNTGHFSMGEVVFPDMPGLLTCGVWGTFFTAIMWYFYLNGNEEAAGALPIGEGKEDGLPSEEGQEVELPDGTIRTKGKDQIKPQTGENPQAEENPQTGENAKDPASAAEDGSKAEGAADAQKKAAAGESAGDKKSGSGKSSGGSGGGGGHKGSGGSGGGSTGSSMPDYHSSIQDDPAAGAAASQAGAAEAAETTAPELPAGGNTDATGDYLRTLLGDGSSVTDGLKSWTKSNMTSWGARAANKIKTGSSSLSGSSPVGKAAGSVVRAAVVNAGIEIAAHGAGAVSAAAGGGGSKDIFEEME